MRRIMSSSLIVSYPLAAAAGSSSAYSSSIADSTPSLTARSTLSTARAYAISVRPKKWRDGTP